MDQLGGIELDDSGAKRRKWQWKDQVTHVHAPPFQPIHFSLNQYIGVRILSQERMVLDFSCGDRGKRFNVGSRLKVGLDGFTYCGIIIVHGGPIFKVFIGNSWPQIYIPRNV